MSQNHHTPPRPSDPLSGAETEPAQRGKKSRREKAPEKPCLLQVTFILGTSQLHEVFQEFNARLLSECLRAKPELYPRLLESLCKMKWADVRERKLQLQLTQYKDKMAEQKRRIEEQSGSAKPGGLTPETIAKIEEAINLL